MTNIKCLVHTNANSFFSRLVNLPNIEIPYVLTLSVWGKGLSSHRLNFYVFKVKPSPKPLQRQWPPLKFSSFIR